MSGVKVTESGEYQAHGEADSDSTDPSWGPLGPSVLPTGVTPEILKRDFVRDEMQALRESAKRAVQERRYRELVGADEPQGILDMSLARLFLLGVALGALALAIGVSIYVLVT